MGIFSRSRSPFSSRQPPATLAIHLAPNTPSPLRPDSIVSGTLVLVTDPASPPPIALQVFLSGATKTWLRTSHVVQHGPNSNSRRRYRHFRDHARLFDVPLDLSHQLEQQQQQHLAAPAAAPQLEIPFEFRVPAGTGEDRSHAYEDPGDQRWTSGPHDAPPSFHWGGDEADCASVEYAVRAQVVFPAAGGERDGDGVHAVKAEVPVFFVPLPRAPGFGEMAKTQRVQVVSSALLSDWEAGKLGWRQRVKDRLSSSTPKAEMQVRVRLPGSLVVGGEFDIGIDIDVLGRSEDQVRIPGVKVKVDKLELRDFTFARASRDRDASTTRSGTHSHFFSSSDALDDMPTPETPYSGHQHEEFDERAERLNAVPEEVEIDVDGVVDGADAEKSDKHSLDGTEKGEKSSLGKRDKDDEAQTPEPRTEVEPREEHQRGHATASFTARIPTTVSPSFRCFSISRYYRLRARVVVEAAGKKFEVDVESEVGEVVAGY